jgi:hypothetical protein
MRRRELPCEDDLLGVAARQVADANRRCGAYAKAVYQARRRTLDLSGSQERPHRVGVRSEVLQDEVLGDREVWGQADPEPVLRDVGEMAVDRARHDRGIGDANAPCRRVAQTRDHLGELTLPVTGDTRDPDHLARTHGEVDLPERLSASVVVR